MCETPSLHPRMHYMHMHTVSLSFLSPSLPPSLSLFLSLTNTHEQLSEKERGEAGVTEDMIRVSVGYEDIEDIQSDFEAGFAAAKQ